ncbi:MAG: M99 family carboxypeptidase catalytic domain-containing protein [Pelovirga sp.]
MRPSTFPVAAGIRHLLCAFMLILTCTATASADFSFIRNSGVAPGPTLLVTAGIDGDEPGGIHAAATLITRYQIKAGQVWVVPDLHPRAILLRERGEMNLKFAHIERNDPLYDSIARIKDMVLDQQVDLLVNLHDGSGFYHPERISRLKNPDSWGQSVVIDQEHLPGTRFGELLRLAEIVAARIEPRVSDSDDLFQIKNMRTATLEHEAVTRKSLSWFALRHGKPALSIEASKTHPVSVRTYYHLLALEALMNQLGITFSRDFELTPQAVARVIREDAQMTLAQGRIHLDLNRMHRNLYDFPLPANPQTSISVINPLISLQPEGEGYRIHYGNNRLALLHPRPVQIAADLTSIPMIIDGNQLEVIPGTILPVNSHVRIEPLPDYRFTLAGDKDDWPELATPIAGDKVSVDLSGRLLRLEIYRGNTFSGMILLDFREEGEELIEEEEG